MEDTQRPRQEAARVHALLGARSAPTGRATDVDLVAMTLALDVEEFHPSTRRAGTLGWLEPGENLIFLRQGLTEPVRRFTLAHEIGHFVLHRRAADTLASDAQEEENEVICDGSDLDAPLDSLTASIETLRPGQAYSGRARRESEANLFAASLLLPANALLDEYQRLTLAGAPGARRLRLLAERFGVTEDVLLRRLTALLLPGRETASGESTDPKRPTVNPAAVLRLDTWQRAAAQSETPALVVAGPGTGKTSTLVGRVAYLVRDAGVPPHSILALTFSNKAAREMRERVQDLLAAEDVAAPASLPTVSTIHAFCGDLLRRYAPLVGLRPDFRLVTETDGYFILRDLSGEIALRRYAPLAAPAQHFPALLGAISRAKDELCGPDRLAEIAAEMADEASSPEERDKAARAIELAEVYSAYQAALTARGDADFGDLVRLTVQLLREHEDVLAEVRLAYRHVLVDEFQDINRAMGVLLRTLAGADGPLWAVGDADQAIYRFRGASPANLARFEDEYPASRIHTLKRNYRSVPVILEAAAGVAGGFLAGGTREALDANRAETTDPAITLATALDEATELAGLVEAIRDAHASGSALDDHVVLCRTRRHCQKVAEALRAAEIPVHMATPLLEQDEVKNVLAVVTLLADTSGAGLLRAGHRPDHAFTVADARTVLAAAQKRRVTPLSLLAGRLDDLEGLSDAARRGLRALARLVADLRRAPDVSTGLARYVFGHTRMGQFLLQDAHGDDAAERSRAASIAQLLALARAFEDRRDGSGRARDGSADWGGFLDYVRVVSALRQEAAGAGDELAADDAGRVRVLTVHASKGLEFPVVYLPGLADRRFPSQRRASVVSLPEALLEDGVTPEDAHLAEEACLFYVALTRARDRLVLSFADQYGKMRYRPSPFLEPLMVRLDSRLERVRWETITFRQPRTTVELIDLADLADPAESADGNRPVRVGEIETYRRCPRQYAYRYVYGLRPSELGLSTLRRTLHDTLAALQVHVEQTGDAPPLTDALELFDRRWLDAAGTLPSGGVTEAGEQAHDVTETQAREPFTELYRSHGRQVVERMWTRLAGQADIGEHDASARGSAGITYEQPVMVRVGSQDIALNLDRVEIEQLDAESRPAARHTRAGTEATRSATAAPPATRPIRLVRHRLGHGNGGQADLRQLLYALAAEQGQVTPAELYTHNLTTGDMERVTLDRRKLTRLRDDLEQTLDGLRQRLYPPRPDPATCQSCPFLLICPA